MTSHASRLLKPPIIGLTGLIGSGKSHVRQMLQCMGAITLDADLVAHEGETWNME
jgi:dephospho-CoA kinase